MWIHKDRMKFLTVFLTKQNGIHNIPVREIFDFLKSEI